MMDEPQELTTGERVARARIARGMSQEALAGLMDRSMSWVSKIERGSLPLDRKSVVLKLAQVLDVDVNVLEGRSPAPTIQAAASRDVLVRELRQALMRWPTEVARHTLTQTTLADLRRRVDSANRMRQDARFTALSETLPPLLADLQDNAHTASKEDRSASLTMLVEAMHDARAMAKKLGYLDLAWMAAEKAGQAAEKVGDPLLLAANNWNHIEVYKAANTAKSALALALRTIDQLSEGIGAATPGHLSLWGMMHLQAALISAYWTNRADSESHLREADEAAQRLGVDANHFETMFGPTNVGIHRVAIGVELGDSQAALDHAHRVDASSLGHERRARLQIDLARAYEHCRKRDEALHALQSAEKLAPDYVRHHPIVHELVVSQLRRTKPELRAFARRAGIM